MKRNVRLVVLMFSALFLFSGTGNISYAQVPGINNVGGFESTLPSFWTIGNQPTGATLTWATDQFRSMGHSLKIAKPGATTDTAAWVSTNMCSVWSTQNPKLTDILVGAYIKTQGVNINPATDDQKWYIAYSFWDSAGVLMKVTKLPINQTIASSTGFVADTNAVGQTLLPRDAWKTIVSFVAGKNATGTVWADDFVLYGRGTWAGQDWNTSVGVPTGMFYYLPPNGGNDGLIQFGFENTIVTTEAAHSGTHSLKFALPITHTHNDAFVGTLRFPLDAGVADGAALKYSVWVKASGLYPDSARKYSGTWGVGLTPLYFTGSGDNYGYNPVKAVDYVFTPQNTTWSDTAHSFDWTLFSIVDTMPLGKNVKYVELRAHVYSTFVGTVYFDDMSVSSVTGINDHVALTPIDFTLYQNYPNPFNPSTSISYNIPKSSIVTLKIYDLLGNEIKTLVNSNQNAGNHQTIWNGDNNFGKKVSSGTYIYTLKANDSFTSRKMVLLK